MIDTCNFACVMPMPCVLVDWHGAQLVGPWDGRDYTFAMCCSSTGMQSKIEGEEPRSTFRIKLTE